MQSQRAFRLVLEKSPTESVSRWRGRIHDLNHPPKITGSDKLLADLLKRHARRVMADITECPPDTIPAHLARLELLTELIRFAAANDLVPDCEGRRSDKQLLYAHTLADFAACLDLTRKTHRAPAFINQRDDDLAAIHRKLDTLAGLFANSTALNAVLQEAIESEVES